MNGVWNADPYIGRSPDSLTIRERAELAGRWFALEIYTPETVPLRLIAAIGESAAACARQLQARGLDPARYEYLPVKPSF